jgi:hypothetical protein
MEAATFRSIIVCTLASTTLGGGQTACSSGTCSEQPIDYDFVASDYTAEVGYGVLPADGGTFDEWAAQAPSQPCETLCDNPNLTPRYSGNLTDCSWSTGQYDGGTVVGLHCAWDYCPAPSSNSTDDGCSLGKGRPPAGFVPRPIVGADPRGRFFALAAQLEAASVPSFAILARDLTDHGAPRHLVDAARRAGRDEVRHARVMTALARRYAVEPPTLRTTRRWTARSLESIAIENAVDGCVQETYAALDASWMAHHARDARVRRALQVVATDETRHGALAWRVAAWASRRLGAESRRRVDAARMDANAQLTRDLSVAPSRALAAAGLAAPAGERLALRASLDRALKNHADRVFGPRVTAGTS